MKKTVLITGGAGFIGTHTAVELLEAGYRVIAVDNLCNSSPVALERVQAITGKTLGFERLDVRDRPGLERVFSTHRIDAVIHFAGLKAVGESVELPLTYYQNNLAGTLTLLEAMRAAGCRELVFSSSATVYGNPEEVPIREYFPLSATNPYGRSKLMIEDVCRDLAKAEPAWRIALLRYFNPVGAHPSGLLGEDPKGIPNNLMPYILQVAVGRRPQLEIFGSDYPTPDGTGVRDYIHVVDLARGHVAALGAMSGLTGAVPINLGTGRGVSVLEMVRAMGRAAQRVIPHRIAERRPGDIACCYADPSRAHARLRWKAERDLDEMCADAWNWQTRNPEGYLG